MKILCICPIGIGNYLLVYPACNLIKQEYPDAVLHLLALRAPIADIAGGDSLWEKIHILDPSKHSSLSTIAQIFKTLRKEKFDICVNLFPSNKWQYNLVSVLCGIPRRYAFSYPLKKLGSFSFLNNRKLKIDSGLHDVQQNIRMAEFISGKSLADKAVRFPVLFSQTETNRAREIVLDGKQRPVVIGIHPGSSKEHGMDAKRWSPERFGELADLICKTLDAEALIFGGPDEQHLKEQVASVMKFPKRIVNPVNLRLTAALLKECTLCLCNDSGLMHIAATSGVPVVAVFGPTSEKRNGPIGSKSIVIRKEMDRFPLWTAENVGVRYVPRDVDPNASLQALTVDYAWGKVAPWLSREINTTG